MSATRRSGSASARTLGDAAKTARNRARRGFASIRHGYRRLTPSRRSLPDFIVIGAQRSGSTSLFRYLQSHPAIRGALVKEPHFFDLNYERGLDWYRAFFPTEATRRRLAKDNTPMLVGEGTPYYIFHPHVPRRVAEVLPDVRLIAMGRNPVDRAFSHYHQQVRRRGQPLTFEQALEIEEQRLERETERLLEDPTYQSSVHQTFSFVARGRYAEQLERWYAVFPREQVHFVRSEDFFDDPAGVGDGVLTFLGLSPWRPQEFPHLGKLGAARMRPETRNRLERYFRPHNQRLAQLLSRDLGWDPVP